MGTSDIWHGIYNLLTQKYIIVNNVNNRITCSGTDGETPYLDIGSWFFT